MKLITFSLLLFGASAGQQFLNEEDDHADPLDDRFNRFGNFEEVLESDLHVLHKNIRLEALPIHVDYRQQAKHLNELTAFLKDEKKFDHPDEVKDLFPTCHQNRTAPSVDSMFMFLPAFTGLVSPTNNSHLEIEGNCFEEVTMDMQYNHGDNQVELTVKTAKKRHWLCSDFFLIANTEIWHAELFSMEGTHKLNFQLPNKGAQMDLENFGLETFLFCEGLQDELLSVIQTLKSMIGGLGLHGRIPMWQPQVPEYMEKATLEFLSWALNWDMPPRGEIQNVDLDESTIHSGDYFAITRLDGLGALIMYGTGSHSGHTVMAQWFDGELYMLESEDSAQWPSRRIQRNRFSEWVKRARSNGYLVTYMPLSDERRAMYNETAATEYFHKVQGLPYGFHNFIYGWIDTPTANFPRVLPDALVPVAFSIIEHFDRNLTDTFFTAGLNKHLDTKGLNISEVALEASSRGMNISEVFAIVEEDGWEYEGQWHDGESMVCSAFVAAMWKAAGIFGDNYINAVEQGPKDVYQMDIFNKTWTRPQACIDADADYPHCQIMGKYRLDFPGWSSIPIYPHMNDNCPSIAPDFVRPDGC